MTVSEQQNGNNLKRIADSLKDISNSLRQILELMTKFVDKNNESVL